MKSMGELDESTKTTALAARREQQWAFFLGGILLGVIADIVAGVPDPAAWLGTK
jgi:hypothetical protein